MNLPTSKDIKELKSQSGGLHISVYEPLDYSSPESINANEIKRKNISRELEKLLSAQFDTKTIGKLLEPLRNLSFSRSHLWQREVKCLAVFVNENKLSYYFLPLDCESEDIIKSDKFFLKPIEDLLANNKTFYILSASYNHAKLYKGDNFSLKELPIKSLPSRGVDTELSIDEYPKSLQFHAAEPSKSSSNRHGNSQQFHGQYNQKEVEKNLILEYFRKINRSVYNLLKHKSTPLLFAGVDYLFPLYKKANSYNHLCPVPIEGNYQRANINDLHQRALAKVR